MIVMQEGFWTHKGGALTPARIRDRMRARGVTVGDLAEALGVKPMKVGQWLNHETGRVGDWDLVRLLLRWRLLSMDELAFTPPQPITWSSPSARVIFASPSSDARATSMNAAIGRERLTRVKLPDGVRGKDAIYAALDPANWHPNAAERGVAGVRIWHEDGRVLTYGLDGREAPVDRLRAHWHDAPRGLAASVSP